MRRACVAWLLLCAAGSGNGCAASTSPALRATAAPAASPVQSAPAAGAQTQTPTPTPAQTPPELFVRCEDRESCPDAVGMLVVEAAADAGAQAEAERCTATLIAPDRVLTASHCLAASARRAGAACAGTWLAFPETADAGAEWIACARVVAATESVHEDGLHQEHAVLQLVRPSTRTPLAIDAAPPEPGSIVTVVSVTPHPVYGTTHVLSTRLCRAIDSTPAERALGDAALNVGWLATCPIARGNSGSPVLDHEGHIRAIVHGGTSLTSAFAVTSDLSD